MYLEAIHPSIALNRIYPSITLLFHPSLPLPLSLLPPFPPPSLLPPSPPPSLPLQTDFDELYDALGHGGLAQLLQVLHDVRGLEAHADGGVQGVGSQLVLVDVDGPTHWLCYGHQEVLGVLVHGREGLQEDVPVRSLGEVAGGKIQKMVGKAAFL